MSVCLLYVTAANRDDALALGVAVVEAGLAACANVLDGMISIYRWQGEMRQDREAVLIVKTRDDLADAAIARIHELHDYDCPCILRLPVEGGNPDFLAWIAAETKPA
jgi:periplasmic divalent cation tolerance protein